MDEGLLDYENARTISHILTLYYEENRSQGEIATLLGLSTTKVNRLLKQARNQGMVEIHLHPPFQHLFDLERQVESVTGVRQAIVTPRLVGSEEATLQAVGRVAAQYLLEHLRDGDTIAMGGGTALSALVQALRTESSFDVSVTPAIGGVQGRYSTDVNNLAAELAVKLGGKSYQLHAPALTDTPQEQEAILNLRQVKEVLDRARRAQVAVVGVGRLDPLTSSYFQFNPLSSQGAAAILQQEGGVGEILARIFNAEGETCAREYAQRVVGIDLDELRAIPLVIGVAALEEKALPVAAALKGGYLKTIVTDEGAARALLKYF